MPNKYKIYVVSQKKNEETFWVFLKQPKELAADKKVFANSSAFMTLSKADKGKNSFTVPVQFKVQASAHNAPVKLGVEISTEDSENAALGENFTALFQVPSKHAAPSVSKEQSKNEEGQIWLKCSSYDHDEEGPEGWYGSLFYGVETEEGIIGMNWSPDPGVTRKITPDMSFYITTGTFGENTLASWSDVANSPAELDATKDFDEALKCTVVLKSNGGWVHHAGPPTQADIHPPVAMGADTEILRHLVESHQLLCESHDRLIALARLELLENLSAEPRHKRQPGRVQAYQVQIMNANWTKEIATGWTTDPINEPELNVIGLNGPGTIKTKTDYVVRDQYGNGEGRVCVMVDLNKKTATFKR